MTTTPIRRRFPETRIPDNASVVGMQRDIAALPSADLLDQYAVLASMPECLDVFAITRVAIIRRELLNRLAVWDAGQPA